MNFISFFCFLSKVLLLEVVNFLCGSHYVPLGQLGWTEALGIRRAGTR